MADFTPEEEYCHCGDLRDMPHVCGDKDKTTKPAHFITSTGKTEINLPADVAEGFKIEILGFVINVPPYQKRIRG